MGDVCNTVVSEMFLGKLFTQLHREKRTYHVKTSCFDTLEHEDNEINSNMGGGKVGLTSDTEVNLWFYKKKKNPHNSTMEKKIQCHAWRRQTFACLLLNLNVLLRSFLYLIITEEISSTYSCKHRTPLLHSELAGHELAPTWEPRTCTGSRAPAAPDCQIPAEEAQTDCPEPICTLPLLLTFCKATLQRYWGNNARHVLRRTLCLQPSVSPAVKGKCCPRCTSILGGFVTGILEAVRSPSGGNLSQSCTISLAKRYNICSPCTLSNSIATTSISAWNKSWQEKIEKLIYKNAHGNWVSCSSFSFSLQRPKFYSLRNEFRMTSRAGRETCRPPFPLCTGSGTDTSVGVLGETFVIPVICTIQMCVSYDFGLCLTNKRTIWGLPPVCRIMSEKEMAKPNDSPLQQGHSHGERSKEAWQVQKPAAMGHGCV